ncbi:MAG: ParA family protein [Anaerolineae bacterium]|jgi:chromosome partitioning protein|nr:ParA family protein [Anaerolineae bacterium]
MRVITFSNEKGGVGKTTTAVTLASGLASRGYNVLLVDTDAQGHGATMLGMERRPALYDWLVRNAPAKNVMEMVPEQNWADYSGRMEDMRPGELALIASNYETMNIAAAVMAQNPDPYVFLRRLMPLAGVFDYVLVDTSPTPSLLHHLIYNATTDIIFCTQAETPSLRGLLDTQLRVDELNQSRKAANMAEMRLLGIQFNRVRAKVIEHEANIRDTAERYPGKVMPSIRERIAWAESAREGKSIFAYAPDSEAALEAFSLVDAVEAGGAYVQA